MDITCIGPDGNPVTVPVDQLGTSGGSQPLYPNLMARRIIRSFSDAQQSIADGKARGFKPFSIEGNGTGVGEGKF
jgi:hypothetical protein